MKFLYEIFLQFYLLALTSIIQLKQKFDQDVPFVAEKINNYAIEIEKQEQHLFLKRKEENNHRKRKEIEQTLYSGKIKYPVIICSIS